MNRPGLILVLMDGISSERFAATRGRLPHLDALARQGLLVERLGADRNANSMPARAGILTGRDARDHGVYSNAVLERGRFRPAAPQDLRGDSLIEAAREAGLRVASLGFGLVRPDSCDWYLSPWWEDGARRAKALTAPTLASGETDREALFRGAANDQRLLHEAAGLIEREAPELVLLELNTPDYCLHVHGDDEALVTWSLELVDAQLGSLLARLEACGRRADYHLGVVSDHGHALVERALVADRLLPGAVLQCDGGLLLVACDDLRRIRENDATLAEHGVTRLEASDFLPAEGPRLQVYRAPAGTSFEPAHKHRDHEASIAAPRYVSTHGLGPGARSDERFAILQGPGVAPGRLEWLDSLALHPRLAALLGLESRGEPGVEEG